MTPRERNYFDQQLERILDELPPEVIALMDEVPLVVENHPAPEICRELGIEYREELCGLYVGRGLDARLMESGIDLPTTVYLFREGVMAAAAEHGPLTSQSLRAEIRKTILHEYGHHRGLSEDELSDLGYG